MSVPDLCRQLDLTDDRCAILQEWLNTYCRGARERKPRRLSRWQECIAQRRKGQKFDPQAIKRLAEEYRAGRCP